MIGKQSKLINKDYLSWVIFLSTLTVIAIVVLTIVFPSLVLRIMGGVTDYSEINPFEFGILTIPFFATTIVIFGIVFLHYKNKLPQLIIKPIQFIFKFEISPKISILVIVIIIGLYVIFTAPELSSEEKWEDYYLLKPSLEEWTIDKDLTGPGHHVKFFLLDSSMKVFNNYKIIPFLTSIGLLVLTYLTVKEITHKRFAGIVSMLVLLQSGTFLTYDTSIVYSNFWVFFYLLSLYAMSKAWPLSPISFILSFFSKAITAMYLPMSFFFMYRSSISRKNKILSALTYGSIIIIGLILHTEYFLNSINFHDFWIYGETLDE